jgi:flagellar biosynthesis/type III secretory pathway M-ring protein FliF/YscJ
MDTITKKVFSKETGKKEENNFLRLNIITDHNFKMHDVDQADQLQNQYRFDHWMRQRKWWWSIFFWGVGVILVNSYVCYREYMKMMGKKKSEILSHYKFREKIALAWIDPVKYWPDRKYKAPTSNDNDTDTGNINCSPNKHKKRKQNQLPINPKL